jgi:hypothetical protein
LRINIVGPDVTIYERRHAGFGYHNPYPGASREDYELLATPQEIIDLKTELREGSERLEQLGGLIGVTAFFAQVIHDRQAHIPGMLDIATPSEGEVELTIVESVARGLATAISYREDMWKTDIAVPSPSSLIAVLESGRMHPDEIRLLPDVLGENNADTAPEVSEGATIIAMPSFAPNQPPEDSPKGAA